MTDGYAPWELILLTFAGAGLLLVFLGGLAALINRIPLDDDDEHGKF